MEESPELQLMCELLKGWGYRAFQTVAVVYGEEKPAVNVFLEPEGMYFKIWASERNHLHLRLLLQKRVLEGEEGFEEAFDNLTVGALKAAVKAAEDIHRACLLIFFVRERDLCWGSLFFRDGANEYGSIAIHEWLRENLREKLVEIIK